MLRVGIMAAGLLACACTPAPAPMSASEASERLERFAAGASALDVCTPNGRALLRGAVRAYSAELANAGVAWPSWPGEGQALHRMDAAVVVAFAAGFVDASDFSSAGRNAASRIALAYWPQVTDMRAAARIACSQVSAVQQAAAHVAAEMERYRRMSLRADPERLRRQRERLENAQAQLEALADAVQAEVARARRS
jgi:hypothetical protein